MCNAFYVILFVLTGYVLRVLVEHLIFGTVAVRLHLRDKKEKEKRAAIKKALFDAFVNLDQKDRAMIRERFFPPRN